MEFPKSVQGPERVHPWTKIIKVLFLVYSQTTECYVAIYKNTFKDLLFKRYESGNQHIMSTEGRTYAAVKEAELDYFAFAIKIQN